MKDKMKVRDLLMETLRILGGAALPILLFEIIYKGIVVLIFKPVLNFTFSLFLKIGGYPVLINADIKNFLTSFLGIATVLIFSYLAVLIVYYEFAVILIMLNRSFKSEDIKIRHCMEKGLIKLSKISRSSNIGLAIYILVLIPFINIGVQSSFLPEINIPAFISGEVLKYTGGQYLILLFIVICTLLYAKSFLVLPIMVIEERTFKKARKKSFEKMKGRGFKVGLLAIIVTFIWMGLAFLPSLIVGKTRGLVFSFLSVFSEISLMVFTILVSPMMLALMLAYFKPYEEEVYTEEAIISREIRLNTIESRIDILRERVGRAFISLKSKLKKKPLLILLVIMIIGGVIYTNLPVNIAYEIEDPLVIGHRGSLLGVENTIEATQKAGDMGAEYAEIDILLSKDGVPMVIHDANLFRLSGKPKFVGNMTQKELEKIKIKDRGYEGRISSLEDFYRETQDYTKLLIEFKTHGREEKSVVKESMKVLEDLDREGNSIFHTAERSLLKEFNENYPDRKIGYIIIGRLGRLNQGSLRSIDSDFLVFEESIASQGLINTCHMMDIPVFVWTVNKEKSAEDLFKMKVDAIITDHPDRMIEVRDRVLNDKLLKKIKNND